MDSITFTNLARPTLKFRVLKFNEEKEFPSLTGRLKPITRYLFDIILRDKPDDGVKVLSVGRQAAIQIIEGLIEAPPVKSKWRRFLVKFGLADFFEKINLLSKFPEQTYDFEMSKEVKNDFPIYDVKRIYSNFASISM